jgi:hypothetical protein
MCYILKKVFILKSGEGEEEMNIPGVMHTSKTLKMSQQVTAHGETRDGLKDSSGLFG